ncbi:hypothetical protein CERSUDRAFT_96924 [Gelatoporia subvermispora B]|uniref:Survival protein SurE-like phosphatase/nucleotidase domain-containing protein n=1 Tax=Ceriporiopsis subvermispora (strain B) TaxID=914234 RepID=M2R8I8_CERS8|nr:hypothetical protein CERSUDRAFT_96924 [Gelatoporia subvermispora B]
MRGSGLLLVLAPAFDSVARYAQNIILTNDDGWATANIRAQYESLTSIGLDAVISAPAANQSGTGSLSKTPTPLTEPCEFDTCPAGSPAEGFNVSDPHLNYVNGYPVDAARFGIQTLAPQFFGGSSPDFVVSGPNVGNNLGIAAIFSGTVGAACEAATEGIPSAAFSGMTGSQVSYTTLDSDPDSTSTLAARVYAELTTYFVQTIASSGLAPLLPDGVTVNVNFAAIDSCPDASSFQWVFSRLIRNPFVTDVQTCGTTHLPSEASVVSAGCFASVTVISATTKLDQERRRYLKIFWRHLKILGDVLKPTARLQLQDLWRSKIVATLSRYLAKYSRHPGDIFKATATLKICGGTSRFWRPLKIVGIASRSLWRHFKVFGDTSRPGDLSRSSAAPQDFSGDLSRSSTTFKASGDILKTHGNIVKTSGDCDSSGGTPSDPQDPRRPSSSLATFKVLKVIWQHPQDIWRCLKTLGDVFWQPSRSLAAPQDSGRSPPATFKISGGTQDLWRHPTFNILAATLKGAAQRLAQKNEAIVREDRPTACTEDRKGSASKVLDGTHRKQKTSCVKPAQRRAQKRSYARHFQECWWRLKAATEHLTLLWDPVLDALSTPEGKCSLAAYSPRDSVQGESPGGGRSFLSPSWRRPFRGPRDKYPSPVCERGNQHAP